MPYLLATKYPKPIITESESRTMIPRFMCQIHLLKTMFKSAGGTVANRRPSPIKLRSLVVDPRAVAGQLPEGRGFQPFEIAFAGFGQRQKMFGNFEHRGRCAMESGVQQHLVEGPAQHGYRGWIVAH